MKQENREQKERYERTRINVEGRRNKKRERQERKKK
jgi:hypothetical protein